MQSAEEIVMINEQVAEKAAFIQKLKNEVAEKIIGQSYMIDRLLIGLLSNGHILLEGVPGLAKTLTIKSLSEAIHAKFSRIQFTPDMLPADVIGTMIYHQQTNEFKVRKGPIFANLILADEINRAPAKVQSALLEAMQERQVTISETSYLLDDPFLVLATQNPLEQEGTYPLPEAQLDRFMLKVVVGYPSKQEEQNIIKQQVQDLFNHDIRAVAELDEIKEVRDLCKRIYMDEKIEKYIVDIVFSTRYPEQYGMAKIKDYISYGGSPRASINLAKAGKAHAFLEGRGYVIPDDIKAISKDVLRHRIGLTYEAEAENLTTETIIDELIKAVPVP